MWFFRKAANCLLLGGYTQLDGLVSIREMKVRLLLPKWPPEGILIIARKKTFYFAWSLKRRVNEIKWFT